MVAKQNILGSSAPAFGAGNTNATCNAQGYLL